MRNHPASPTVISVRREKKSRASDSLLHVDALVRLGKEP